MRKILFNRESPCLQPLRELIEKQTHKALVLWALEAAEEMLPLVEEKYPCESRPREAVEKARAWARGEIKMPEARKAILACHAAASAMEEDFVSQARTRAIGQGISSVHAETHAIGFPIYALTALARSASTEEADAAVEKECARLCRRLAFWEGKAPHVEGPWATFMEKEGPNKERLRREKMEKKEREEGR